jgi:hypothetical protein
MPGRIIAIETVARRDPRLFKPIYLPLSLTQRRFLLYRLADLTATAEAILHRKAPAGSAPRWSREQVLGKTAGLVAALRTAPNVFILGDIDKAIVIEGIEGNRYFAQMADDDPRLCAAGIAQADALRLILQTKLKQPIRPVPLGRPRLRLPAPPPPTLEA